MEMEDENITLTEDELNERLNRSYKDGIERGISLVAQMLLREAMSYFGSNKDDYANLFRNFHQKVMKETEGL